jgi:hypothetical protein
MLLTFRYFVRTVATDVLYIIYLNGLYLCYQFLIHLSDGNIVYNQVLFHSSLNEHSTVII